MPWIDRGWYLVVEFEQSSSNSFERVLRLVRAHESYCQLMDHRGHVFHRVTFSATDASAACGLLDLVKQWRSTRVYVKGDETEPGCVHTQLDCYLWHVEQAGIENCPLGPGRDWPLPKGFGSTWDAIRLIWPGRGGVRWFEYGAFESKTVYAIEKDLVRRLANEYAEAHRACPLCHAARMDEVLERLPERIDLDDSPEWESVEVVRTHPSWSGRAAETVVTVQPRSAEAYRRYVDRILDGLQFEWPSDEVQDSS